MTAAEQAATVRDALSYKGVTASTTTAAIEALAALLARCEETERAQASLGRRLDHEGSARMAATARAAAAEADATQLRQALEAVQDWFERKPWTGSADGGSFGCGEYTPNERALGYGTYRDPRFLPAALVARAALTATKDVT